MAEKNLDDLVETVARRFGRVLRGTTSAAGSTTTLVDAAALFQPADFWTNYYVRILTGALAGQERLVLSNSQTAKQLTVDPAFASAVGQNEGYFISSMQRADYDSAVREAIATMGSDWVVIASDESQKMTVMQEYALPANCLYLMGVYVGANGYWTPFTGYEVWGNAGAYTMRLRTWPDAPLQQLPPAVDLAKMDMRLVYAALPGLMPSSSSSLGLGEVYEREALTFITNYALYLLHQMAISRNRTGEDARTHLTLSQQVFQEAMRIRDNRTPQQVARRTQSRPLPRFVQ